MDAWVFNFSLGVGCTVSGTRYSWTRFKPVFHHLLANCVASTHSSIKKRKENGEDRIAYVSELLRALNKSRFVMDLVTRSAHNVYSHDA